MTERVAREGYAAFAPDIFHRTGPGAEFGYDDEYIPNDQVEAIQGALADAGVRHDTVVYPGAPHGFHCDQRDSYQAKAAGDAWDRVQTLFRDELGG